MYSQATNTDFQLATAKHLLPVALTFLWGSAYTCVGPTEEITHRNGAQGHNWAGMQHTVWCKASSTYTNQITAVLIKNWKELLNCFCSMNHQCKVVLQWWRTERQCMHNVSWVYNSYFTFFNKTVNQLTLLSNATSCRMVRTSPSTALQVLQDVVWQVWRGGAETICTLYPSTYSWSDEAHKQDTWGHSGVHPLHKGTTIQTIIHAHTHYMHTN